MTFAKPGGRQHDLRFPKPRRIVDQKALKRYRAANPYCEVCGRPAMPTPHHLKPVSTGGDDIPDNLLSLDVLHHTGREGWHPLGGHEWLRRFGARLRPDALRKVRLALRMAA